MDLKAIPINVLLLDVIVYGCLPLWLIMGFIDWYCHRKSRIEETTGLRESFLHAVMGLQVGIPVFLGLFFEINVLQFLIMFAVLILHEVVAHMDVKYALHTRKISILETHIHSFMEVLPFVVVVLLICMKWSAFVDLITFNWVGNMGIAWKRNPLNNSYLTAYFCTLIVIDIIPYMEEMWRCYRHHRLKNQEAD